MESRRPAVRVVGRDLGGRQQVVPGSRNPAQCVVAAECRIPATCLAAAGDGGSAFGFGDVCVVDDMLHEGADLGQQGRHQERDEQEGEEDGDGIERTRGGGAGGGDEE